MLAQKEKTGGAKNNNQITRTAINSMMVGEGHKVDTLTLLDRIAVRTNAFDWFLLIPNIGVEFDVKPRNWNRWTVGISARGNWKTAHTYNPSMVYNLAEVRLEGRQYWRTRDMGYDHQTGKYNNLEPHKKYHLWDKAVSIRRKQSRYPSTTFFRGVYVSYMDYSLKLFDTGRQGQAINAGVTWGIVRNLYAFRNGNSLDIEFGIRGGFMYTKNTEYTHDAESDCYPIKKLNDWHLVMHPVINDLSVTLVYRLGKYPSLWKYRYRDDVDAPYAEAKRERRMTAEKTRRDTRLYEHVHDSINREFIRIYDMINRGARQQEEAEMKAKEEAAKKKLQQEKEAERQRRAEEKEAEKAAKAARKEAEQQDEKPANSEAPKKEETEGKEAADE
ncbi:MAG: DUF3575 domain-containing protein [Prevotella sp.]|nr:DUF3575 domain-containing protein [Prevotella sp.]